MNIEIAGWFYMPYFKPTIMLQYISSSESQDSNPLEVSKHFNDIIVSETFSERLKLTRHKPFSKECEGNTVYSKTFKWENFHGFSADCKSFPLESFAEYST